MPRETGQGPEAPSLSVVIVAWNSADDVGRAVASAHSPLSEVIVVDNASSDGSADAARSAGADVVVEAGENLGFAGGCNLGVRHANAPLVLFLNPDAALQPGGVEAIHAFFDARPNASILGPAVADEAGRRARTAGDRWSLMTEFGNKTLLHRLVRPLSGTRRVAWVSGAALVARMKALRRLGGFDPKFFLYYEDLDLCARAADAGLEVWFSDTVEVLHVGKRSSRRVEERALVISEASTQRYWRLHGGRLRAAAVRVLTLPEMALRSAVWSALSIDSRHRPQARARLRAYRRIGVMALGAPVLARPGIGKEEGPEVRRPGPYEIEERPPVSVVIATFNRGGVVGRAIDCALNQTYAPLEIIVVDDGSTDDTPAVLDRFAGRIKVLRQDNAERAAARNAGLVAASGKLIAFLDSDDEWLPSHLEAMVHVLVRRPEIGLAYRQAELYDDDAGRVFDLLPRHPTEGDLFFQSAAGNRMVVDGVLVRGSLLDEVGGFDEELTALEDWELWTRCLAVSPAAFVPGLTVRVHFHSRNTVGNRVVMQRGIRAANSKILDHPVNGPRLAGRRRRLRAGMWALLAHTSMLAGEGKEARALIWEGIREDPYTVTYAVFWTMALKVLAGPGFVRRGRLLRRRAHLWRVGGTPEQEATYGDPGSPSGSGSRLVTVVIPCFSARRWLPGCLESIRQQTYRDVEIIVVDGGSQDGTTEFLESQKGITWVSERDEGQSDAIAKGFEMAKGDVLCWVNADDRLRPRACEVVVSAMERTEADLVFGSAEIIDAEGHRIRLVHPPEELRLRDFVNDVAVPQPSTFFSAALFRSVGGVDRSKHLAFDTDLWIRFTAAGTKATRVPIVLSEIIYHDETKTSTHTHAAFRREAASALEAWGGPRLGATMQGVVVATQLIDNVVRPDRAVEGVAQALAGRDDELVGAGSELVRRAAKAEVPRLVGRLARAPRPMQRGAAQAAWWRLKTALRSRWLDRSIGRRA